MAGMGAMFVLILLGVPWFISLAALLGGIAWVVAKGSGPALFELMPNGIAHSVSPFLKGKQATTKRFYAFQDIVSFANDTDLGRGLQQIESLKIQLKTSPFTVIMNDQVNPEGFRAFRDAFKTAIAQYNAGMPVATAPPSQSTTPKLEVVGDTPPWVHELPLAPHTSAVNQPGHSEPIRELPGFYKRPMGKILSVFFTLLTAFFLLVWAGGGMGFLAAFRVLVFMLPGSLYMLYRSFFKK